MSTVKTPKGTELPLLNLKGKNYLQVAHRILWFREEKPTWTIETDLIDKSDKHCIAKATIKDESGRVIATAHKREDVSHFPDAIEKAETGSIGRALALCGYGTQFTDDLEEGGRLADSPLAPKGALPIGPEQPMPGDGIEDNSYRITFGKFNKRSLEEVGPDELGSYVNYLEAKAARDGKEITGMVLDFINRATQYIVAYEKQATKELRQ